MINIVLFQPEIPQNTGNIMRTCMASDMHLILIKPLGFKLDEKHLRRAGMDYINNLSYEVFDNFADFEKAHQGDYYFITRYAKQSYAKATYNFDHDIYLIFGSESSGIDKSILQAYKDNLYRIPMNKDARSLNLSNCVALVGYDCLRQNDFFDLVDHEVIKGADFIDR